MNGASLTEQLHLRQLRGQELLPDDDVHTLISHPGRFTGSGEELDHWIGSRALSPQARLALLRLRVLKSDQMENAAGTSELQESQAFGQLRGIPLRMLSHRKTLDHAAVRALIYLLLDWPWNNAALREYYAKHEQCLLERNLAPYWTEKLTSAQRHRLETL